MNKTVDHLSTLHKDTKRCAQLVGLRYSSDKQLGFSRRKQGKGFSLVDDSGRILTDKKLLKHIQELVIPPAWKEVWICPEPNGHILVTGQDEKGRKQYIYHPKWRAMRDLIKFYRMILFADALPRIRDCVDKNLDQAASDFDQVIAAMLWLLDNTYIRVGNDTYYQQNESIGLTTLTDQSVIIAGPVVTLVFGGKSGKPQQLVVEHPAVARIIRQARDIHGPRLFQHKDDQGIRHPVTASHINTCLKEITGQSLSAKDFRTWGGTLIAFDHLIRQADKDIKPEKDIIRAVDTAAGILGNTRAVARSSYIHPDILNNYGSKYFQKHLSHIKKTRKKPGLDKRETELKALLEILFEQEFTLLKGR